MYNIGINCVFLTGAGGGHKFAQIKGTMGVLDWDDTQTMILEALKLGFVNAKNIAIAGYSIGGFLAAWGCTRPANNEYSFKAGVCGAGLTSWGSLVESSDCPDLGVSYIARSLRLLIMTVLTMYRLFSE